MPGAETDGGLDVAPLMAIAGCCCGMVPCALLCLDKASADDAGRLVDWLFADSSPRRKALAKLCVQGGVVRRDQNGLWWRPCPLQT